MRSGFRSIDAAIRDPAPFWRDEPGTTPMTADVRRVPHAHVRARRGARDRGDKGFADAQEAEITMDTSRAMYDMRARLRALGAMTSIGGWLTL